MFSLLINFAIASLQLFDSTWFLFFASHQQCSVLYDCLQKHHSRDIGIEKRHVQLRNSINIRNNSQRSSIIVCFECDWLFDFVLKHSHFRIYFDRNPSKINRKSARFDWMRLSQLAKHNFSNDAVRNVKCCRESIFDKECWNDCRGWSCSQYINIFCDDSVWNSRSNLQKTSPRFFNLLRKVWDLLCIKWLSRCQTVL